MTAPSTTVVTPTCNDVEVLRRSIGGWEHGGLRAIVRAKVRLATRGTA